MIAFAKEPTIVHSAHHEFRAWLKYSWHPLCEQEVTVQYREHRRGELVYICQTPDGTCEVIPAWMFDSARCVQMRVGQAQISAKALAELRALLSTLGFDQSLIKAENQQEKKKDAAQSEEVEANPPGDNEAVATVSKYRGKSMDRSEGSGSGSRNPSDTVTQSGTERSAGRNE